MSTQVIIINTRKFQVSTKSDIFDFDIFDSKKGNSKPQNIYPSGINNVYCSDNIYGSLNRRITGCNQGPELFIIDNRNSSDPKLIPTTIRSITYGRGADTTGTIINGKGLTSLNSVEFVSVSQFHRWLNAIIGEITFKQDDECINNISTNPDQIVHVDILNDNRSEDSKNYNGINPNFNKRQPQEFKGNYMDFSSANIIKSDSCTVNLTNITSNHPEKNLIQMHDGEIRTEGHVRGNATVRNNYVDCSGLTVGPGSTSIVFSK